MDIKVIKVVGYFPVKVMKVDRLAPFGMFYSETEDRLRASYRVNVDGIPWTVEQTEQARRDAKVCRCRQPDCACCSIASALLGVN